MPRKGGEHHVTGGDTEAGCPQLSSNAAANPGIRSWFPTFQSNRPPCRPRTARKCHYSPFTEGKTEAQGDCCKFIGPGMAESGSQVFRVPEQGPPVTSHAALSSLALQHTSPAPQASRNPLITKTNPSVRLQKPTS